MTASVESPRFEKRALRMVASGWRLAGSFRAMTGPWLTITTGRRHRAERAGRHAARRTRSATTCYADQSINPANGFIRWLDPTAFAQPAAGTFGNMARNSVRGPDNKNVDLALTRVFPIGGRQGIEIRAEAFNAFNWFEMGQPAGTATLSFAARRSARSTSAFPPRDHSAGGEIHFLESWRSEVRG